MQTQSKALCMQQSQHLLSKGHQTHHSGLERFRHISVMYESAIKDHNLEDIQSSWETLIWTTIWLLNKINSSQLKCKHMFLENV